MIELTAIYRHPVKALGTEPLPRIALRAGQGLPGDRVWALAHQKTAYDWAAPGWARCSAFLRGAHQPALMAVTAEGAPGGPITFRHPDRPDLTVDPGTPEGEAAFVAWADPLIAPGAPRPARLTPRIDRPMTDDPSITVSLLSDASRRALEQRAGRPLDRRRVRGNLWVDGLPPWAEVDLLGAELRLGEVRLKPVARIERCSAPQANPDTGRRDVDVCALLEEACGHRDFGLLAEVVAGGEIAVGDAVQA
ncbi:MAG: MOSC domain-containing protein [Pseudomonadota bacterium]